MAGAALPEVQRQWQGWVYQHMKHSTCRHSSPYGQRSEVTGEGSHLTQKDKDPHYDCGDLYKVLVNLPAVELLLLLISSIGQFNTI